MQTNGKARSVFKMLVVLVLSAQEILTKEICVDHDHDQNCLVRFELQFDFGFAFESNCGSILSNCVCIKETYLAYYDHPPYIFYDKKTNNTQGLLVGKSIQTYLFSSYLPTCIKQQYFGTFSRTMRGLYVKGKPR